MPAPLTIAPRQAVTVATGVLLLAAAAALAAWLALPVAARVLTGTTGASASPGPAIVPARVAHASFAMG